MQAGGRRCPKQHREGKIEPAELCQVVNASDARLRQCPKCGEASPVRQEGCDVGESSAHSKCG